MITAELPTDLITRPVEEPKGWSLWARIGFRVAFLYWMLFCFGSSGQIVAIFSDQLSALAEWAGQAVFHLQGTAASPHVTGSGDTALAYIAHLCSFVLAVLGAIVWSILDRRRGQYRTLYGWLNIAVRFTLAMTMVTYGAGKVFPVQFPTPGARTLTETYGDSSPMALLWTFMGASQPYTFAAGMAECMGGLLLLFRRTSTLGALLSAGVMANVLLLNLCYDVPVKIYSAHLLLASLFLLLPDAAAMYRFFVLRQEATLTEVWRPNPQRPKRRWIPVVGQSLVVAYSLVIPLAMVQQEGEMMSQNHIQFYGFWTVDSFKGSGTPWSSVVLDDDSFVAIKTKDGQTLRFMSQPFGDVANDVRLSDPNDLSDAEVGNMAIVRVDAQHAKVSAALNGLIVAVSMHLDKANGFLLQTRGFHWISEYPFNQ